MEERPATATLENGAGGGREGWGLEEEEEEEGEEEEETTYLQQSTSAQKPKSSKHDQLY